MSLRVNVRTFDDSGIFCISCGQNSIQLKVMEGKIRSSSKNTPFDPQI